MSKYGTFAADGSIQDEADVCAVSGSDVLGYHATMFNVGAGHFVRVLSHKEHLVTEEMRAEWAADCGVQAAEEPPARRGKKQTSADDVPPEGGE
jgi:hypothetical protein